MQSNNVSLLGLLSLVNACRLLRLDEAPPDPQRTLWNCFQRLCRAMMSKQTFVCKISGVRLYSCLFKSTVHLRWQADWGFNIEIQWFCSPVSIKLKRIYFHLWHPHFLPSPVYLIFCCFKQKPQIKCVALLSSGCILPPHTFVLFA